MVATIAAGTTARYYSKQSEYYLGGGEPAGRWISSTNDFGVRHGTEVDNALFERLHASLDADGQPLLSNSGDTTKRVGGIDLTLSAPKSVSVAFALADAETRGAIEKAQHEACEATIAFLERNAAFCRRGKDGHRLERATLTVASFQHGEARPVEHDDGKVYADPNLHTHAVLLNFSLRQDGTVGALDARHLFAHKMAAGAVYHLALSSNLKKLGFEIGEVGRNGLFDLVVPQIGDNQSAVLAKSFAALQHHFSGRRKEIEQAIAAEGLSTSEAPALAAAIALGTRSTKQEARTTDRFELWAEEAAPFLDVDRLVTNLRTSRTWDPAKQEKLIAARVAAVPAELTEHESVFERRQLYAAVATALVGTGADAMRVEQEVDHLLETGRVVELGRDSLQQPVYSTPEQIAIERELVSVAERLAREHRAAPDPEHVLQLCRERGLSAEQTHAAQMATSSAAIAVIEGAAGSGKSTTLATIVAAYSQGNAAGFASNLAGPAWRIIGTSQSWKVAKELQKLGIEAMATDAWLARTKEPFLDANTVLVVDEAGLLSSRQMLAIVERAAEASAKIVAVGDREQLPALGAGPGLSILASVTGTTRVDTIVRQREAWMRTAVTDFAKGRAKQGFAAFEERGLLKFAAGEKATVTRVVDAWENAQRAPSSPTVLLIAKTNAQVRALNNEVRVRLKRDGRITGEDVEVATVTPSGHGQALAFATGDHIRFLVRHDRLAVINGTTATVIRINGGETQDPTLHVEIAGRQASFRVSELADEHGRARLGHAYSTTIYGSQGLTTDQAFVWAGPSMTRNEAYVAFSRARDHLEIFADLREIDAQVRLDLPLSERLQATITPERRLEWFAGRLSRLQVKTCTLDPMLDHAVRVNDRGREREPAAYERG
ncbi:MobF family relaxase [Bradyrhizobium liaoningense]|uniref:MobF family relaxase n=1 Tax=Bradyrhizobium liaoningense TaxID=43992 RepID=UPI001BAD5EB8|nr:MobF family relaxase [Bradyrhizobium liaoningense]MBR0818891.1 relaxase domain-containing protein [Bradyrhizobium liaoningense]